MEAKEEALLLRSGHSSGPVLPIIKLVARLLCFSFTLISLITLTVPIIIVSNNLFDSVLLYRYALFSTILGLVYSLLQISVSIYNLSDGNGKSKKLVPLDFYGDMVILYALATGAVAASDLRIIRPTVQAYGNGLFIYLGSNNVAAASLFLGCIYSAVSLLLSTNDFYHRYFKRCYE